MRGLCGVTAVAGVLLAACGSGVGPSPTPTPRATPSATAFVPASTSSSSSTSGGDQLPAPAATLIYRTAWIGVLGIANVPPSGAPHLWVTRDFSHWTDETPPPLRSDGDARFDDAWFTDGLHGWVTSYSDATTMVDLYRTADGGRTWLRIPSVSGHTASAGGVADIQFLSASLGYMDTLQPTAPAAALSVTTDGGLHWASVASSHGDGSLPLGRVRFLDASHAVASEFIVCATVGSALTVAASSDGGRTWAPATLPASYRPADGRTICPAATSFRGTAGVLPVAAVGAQQSSLAFLLSSDSGRTWTLGATLPQAFAPTSDPGSAMDVQPVGAVGFDGSWWATGPLPAGGRATLVSTDSGRTWHSVAGRGLPARVFTLYPIDSHRAWAVGVPDGGAQVLLSTSDGGATWTPLNPAG